MYCNIAIAQYVASVYGTWPVKEQGYMYMSMYFLDLDFTFPRVSTVVAYPRQCSEAGFHSSLCRCAPHTSIETQGSIPSRDPLFSQDIPVYRSFPGTD